MLQIEPIIITAGAGKQQSQVNPQSQWVTTGTWWEGLQVPPVRGERFSRQGSRTRAGKPAVALLTVFSEGHREWGSAQGQKAKQAGTQSSHSPWSLLGTCPPSQAVELPRSDVSPKETRLSSRKIPIEKRTFNFQEQVSSGSWWHGGCYFAMV